MCNATVAVPGCEEVPRAEEGFIFIGNIESVTLTVPPQLPACVKLPRSQESLNESRACPDDM